MWSCSPRLYAKDVIDPENSIPGPHGVLITTPFEKEVATRSGYHDETVTFDGTVCTALELLRQHAKHMLKTRQQPHLNIDDMPLWNNRAKVSLEAFRAACEHLGFDIGITTIYQTRHGGASGILPWAPERHRR